MRSKLAWLGIGFGFFLPSISLGEEGEVLEQQDLYGGTVQYLHIQRPQPRPMHIHAVRINLKDSRIEWNVVAAEDPDGDGPAEASLTSPFQLAKQETNVIAIINTNPWSALPRNDGRPESKPTWYPGLPVDITGLVVANQQLRSKPQEGYVSVWRDKMGRHELGRFRDKVENVQEGFGGFQQIVSKGARTVNSDTSIHPRTGVGLDRERNHMWFVVVDGRQPGYSEGMSTVELADLLLELGCHDAANLDGGGSSILALRDPEKKGLSTRNRPSDRILNGFSVARPLPTAVVIKDTAP